MDMIMNNEQPESALEKVKDLINNAVGLPPGKYPNGDPKPSNQTDEPRETLTSGDAEGVPVPHGTGIKPL
jgi:hypothetical protein